MKQNYLWFQDGLSDKDSKSLLSQLHPAYLGTCSHSLREALGNTHWADTIEGHNYWYNVFMSIHEGKTIPSPSVSENDAWMKYTGYDSSKKIIGYKAPYDLFKGRIKAGAIFSEFSSHKLVMYNKEYMTSGVATEIVKTWEPVYQEHDVTLFVGRPETRVTVTANGRIEAKGQQIPASHFKEVHDLMTGEKKLNTWPIHIREIIIGCSVFTKEEIKKIWEVFVKLNPNYNKKS